MDIKQLQTFVSVAQTLNFTRAAEENYLTQPAISHQIGALERSLGVKLVNRTSHNVVLTSAGKELYEYAVEILDLAKQAETRVFNIANGKSGRIKLFAVATSTCTVIDSLSAFSARYPEVQVDIDVGTGSQQISAISNNSHDFYFSFESLLRSGPSLECLTAYEDRFGLFVHHRDAAGVDTRDFSTPGRLKLISYGYNDAPYLVERVMDICNRRGFDTKNRIEVRSFSNLVIHINAGMGFTILPLSAAEYICTKNVAILPIRGDDTALTGAVGWNRTVKNNAAESFIGMLRAMYEG